MGLLAGHLDYYQFSLLRTLQLYLNIGQEKVKVSKL